jgi:hypothetical protein
MNNNCGHQGIHGSENTGHASFHKANFIELELHAVVVGIDPSWMPASLTGCWKHLVSMEQRNKIK